ncbi:MAG TPA: DUF1552 domain-containing protein [Gammaproteobacteria bacterium]|nr:DUF1552 domain-containing protein [Gammaproteobacteria bacterium]
MFITKKHLSRRTVLRGAVGAAIGLPLLDAMVPAASAAPPPQLRFGAVYVPNGVRPEVWTPASVGRLELPPLLQRFAPLRDHINIVTGIRAPDPFGHHVIGSLWLSGGSAKQTQAADVRADQTIDQHIADVLGRDTPLRSLELGIENINSASNSCQFGWSCIYLNTLAWATATSPLPVEMNPQSVFERMFGDIGSAEERAARFKAKASILDSVIAAASRLNSELPAQDRSTVEEYLQNIREVESRIQASGHRADAAGETPDAPAGIPGSYDEHVRVMYDLIALAWRADITRVATFMKGVEASSIGYPQIGVPESHHIVSHHGNVPETIVKYAKINAYHVSLFGDFVEKLRATPDGDGSLLDHSLVMYGSGMGNGDKHDQSRIPIMLAGSAAGRLKGGRHIANPDPTPLANLIAGLGVVAGLDLGKIENSTGVVEL